MGGRREGRKDKRKVDREGERGGGRKVRDRTNCLLQASQNKDFSSCQVSGSGERAVVRLWELSG